jgi:hypothetical protein
MTTFDLTDNAKTLLDYEYIKPPKEFFGSWVWSDGLE